MKRKFVLILLLGMMVLSTFSGCGNATDTLANVESVTGIDMSNPAPLSLPVDENSFIFGDSSYGFTWEGKVVEACDINGNLLYRVVPCVDENGNPDCEIDFVLDGLAIPTSHEDGTITFYAPNGDSFHTGTVLWTNNSSIMVRNDLIWSADRFDEKYYSSVLEYLGFCLSDTENIPNIGVMLEHDGDTATWNYHIEKYDDDNVYEYIDGMEYIENENGDSYYKIYIPDKYQTAGQEYTDFVLVATDFSKIIIGDEEFALTYRFADRLEANKRNDEIGNSQNSTSE